MENITNPNLNNRILKSFSFKANQKKVAQTFDLFIGCSGFEERTIGLVNKLNSKTKIKQSILFVYKPKEEFLYLQNLENLGKFRKILSNTNNDNLTYKNIDPSNPWEFRKMISLFLIENKINSTSRVLLDITSFTRVFLYEVIQAILSTNCELLISYTEPYDYAETLPTGINQLIISPSFPGKPRPYKKSVLLLFLGWEKGRTFSLYEAYNADETIPVIGVCPIDKKHVIWSEKSTQRHSELLLEINNVKYTSTLNLDEIIRFVSKVYHTKKAEYKNNGEDSYFVISGLGPKIQNLAACLFSTLYSDVQLVYGVPTFWGSVKNSPPERPIESRGIGRTYLYGPFTKSILKKKLQK